MSAPVQPRLTPEEYLKLERQSDFRNEYFEGKMFAMSGGTPNHAFITANLAGELYNALKKTDCRVASSDLRIRVSPDGLYTYPDISVVCGQAEFSGSEADTLANPALVIEVLSPTTEAYDRGFKAVQYRKIISLQEYVFVSQNEARVEVFRRQHNGTWLLSESAGMSAACRFDSVNCDVALADIYAEIVWPGEDLHSNRPSAG